MEDLQKYNQHLEIEPNTKKLFMEMIRGLKSIFETENPLFIEDNKDLQKNELELFTYVEDVIFLADENPDVLSGIYNVRELKQYLKYTRDYQDMINQVEELLNSVRQYQSLTKQFTINLARMVKEHVEMVSTEEPVEKEYFAMPDFMDDKSGGKMNDPPVFRIIQ